jgi:hypothetical protein
MAVNLDDGYLSVIDVVKLISTPLSKAVYGSDFRRGRVVADGQSFFVGEDVWTPQIFSLIGEVNELWFNGSEWKGARFGNLHWT